MMTKLPRPGGYHRLSDLIPVLTLSQRPDVRSWKSAKGAIPRPTTTTPTITNGSRVSTSASSLLATETEVMGAIGHDGQLADGQDCLTKALSSGKDKPRGSPSSRPARNAMLWRRGKDDVDLESSHSI